MLYKSDLKADLCRLMTICGELELEQLRMYYSHQFKYKKHLDPYLDALVAERFMDKIVPEDESEPIKFRVKGKPPVNPDYQKRVTESFWIPAAHTAMYIRDVQTGGFPMLMTIIFEENRIMDIAVIRNQQEAQQAKINITNMIPEGTDDVIVHVAIVDNPKLAAEIERYHIFDAWVMTKDIINGKKVDFYRSF